MKNPAYLLYFFFAFLFILLQQIGLSFSGLFIIKAIPVSLLMVLAFYKAIKPVNVLLAAGFFFSVLGDVSLQLDRKNLFLLGLVFFLIAHVFYIVVFLRFFSFTKKKIISLLILLSYALVLAYSFRHIDANLFIPVYLYLSIITIMVFSALFTNNNYFYSLIGAILFMLSDSIIAVDKFIAPINHSHLYIMVLYFSAQFLIAYDFIKNNKKEN